MICAYLNQKSGLLSPYRHGTHPDIKKHGIPITDLYLFMEECKYLWLEKCFIQNYQKVHVKVCYLLNWCFGKTNKQYT